MAHRPCLDCGTLSPNTRCPSHARLRERARTQVKRQTRPRASAAETQRRADVVAAWRATRGDWCPGWQRAPHASADLTADHIAPVGAGGAEGGPLTVLCRSCNGRKQAQG
jgi:5-methylcytosine-specific restriction enzyme A